MSELEPPAVWWSATTNAVYVYETACIDLLYAGERPADVVRLVPDTGLLARIEWALFGTTDGDLVEDDAELPVGELRRLLRTAVPDTGRSRETGADWIARPRRSSPEDTLSVAERLGAAGPSGDTDPNHVLNAVANVLLELYGALPLSVRYRAADEAAKVVAQWQAVTSSAHSDRLTRAAGVIGTVGSCASTSGNRPTL